MNNDLMQNEILTQEITDISESDILTEEEIIAINQITDNVIINDNHNPLEELNEMNPLQIIQNFKDLEDKQINELEMQEEKDELLIQEKQNIPRVSEVFDERLSKLYDWLENIPIDQDRKNGIIINATAQLLESIDPFDIHIDDEANGQDYVITMFNKIK